MRRECDIIAMLSGGHFICWVRLSDRVTELVHQAGSVSMNWLFAQTGHTPEAI